MKPEDKARQEIDAQLSASGWVVQDFKVGDFSVVLPYQIRTILRTYRDVVPTELFPDRTLLPKTLIFAKDDSHAEGIVKRTKENAA